MCGAGHLAAQRCRLEVSIPDLVVLMPPGLDPGLLQVGKVGERAEALRGERLPGGAERLDDLVVVVEDPVAEVALAQVEPDAPDRVQPGRAGRQRDECDVPWHLEVVRVVPAGAIENEGGMPVLRPGGGERDNDSPP